ncbi:hypothetical protein DFR70_10765 [Nocardia tenerifensis]|uniref:Homeodomain-like domain-containing protein n=1 Tax=Nocardia tenerifensis TaxID=228006 RepID=A0A318K1M0_9NOCA|nr:hypothetical protein [Nocardia tenerifensis]PXX62198.1 hypothetical protein DFR70_10765 [Nocardia tenerifensis]
MERVPLRDLIAAIERAYPGDSLAQVAAMILAAHLGRLADQLLDSFVDLAHRAGQPWNEIGARLGVSRQAAHQRFAPRRADPTASHGYEVPTCLGSGQ